MNYNELKLYISKLKL
eukprot:UN07359